MVGKIPSKAANSGEVAIVKSSRNEDGAGGTGEIPAFKSLLDALQGSQSGAYEKDGLLTEDMLSEDRPVSLAKEQEADQTDQQAENIFRILSEGSLDKEDLESQLGKLLSKLKQEGRGKPDPLTEAAESDPMSKSSAETTRSFSEENLEDGDLRTQLKQLFEKLKIAARGPTLRLGNATAGGQSRMEAGREQVRQPDTVISGIGRISSDLLSDEEMARLTKAVGSVQMSKASAEIARLFSDGSMEDGEIKTELRKLLNQLNQAGQESADPLSESEESTEKAPPENGPNRDSASGEGKKEWSPVQLQNRDTRSSGPESGKKSDAGLIPEAGRGEKMENAAKQKESTDNVFLKGVRDQ